MTFTTRRPKLRGIVLVPAETEDRNADPVRLTLVESFAAAVRNRPHTRAVLYPAELTYAQLSDRVAHTAHVFRAAGVVRGDAVALWTIDGIDYVVAALATLSLGAVFVPIDARTPAVRVTELLEDCHPRVLFVDTSFKGRLEAACSVPLLTPSSTDLASATGDAPVNEPPSGASPLAALSLDDADLACVLYTSGSTGRPKGVKLSHGNLAHIVRARRQLYGDAPVVLPLHPVSFDPHLGAWAWALGTGGSVVLVPSDQLLDLRRVGHLVGKLRPTHLSAAANLYAELLSETDDTSLHSLLAVLVGGEPLDARVANTHRFKAPEARLFNEYGPTETTVTATVHEVRWPLSEPIPIGRPLPGVSCHVLDEAGEPCAEGSEGELWIGGAGVTSGYLGQVQTTEQRFVLTRYDRRPLYRTGDRVRRNSDGELEFRGRLDAQLKVRGNRLEPAEVERELLRLPGVLSAAVVLVDGPHGVPVLAGFYAPDPELSMDWIRSELAQRLPPHAVPTHLTALAALPVDLNGKVHRARLRAWNFETSPRTSSTPPATATEREIATIWADVLRVDLSTVSREHSFLALGGHSLLVVKVQRRIQERLHRSVNLSTLLSASSLAEVSARVDASPPAHASRLPKRTVTRVRLAPVQETFHALEALESRPGAYVIGAGIHIKGPLDPGQLRRATLEVVRRNDSLRAHVEVENGEPFLVFDSKVSSARQLDWTEEECDGPQAVANRQRSFLERPMFIREPPLVRFQLLRSTTGEHFFTLAAHHIVFDGASVQLFFRELWRRYELRSPDSDSPVAASYATVASALRARLEGPRKQALVDFWRRQLAQLPEPVRPPPTYSFSEAAAKRRGSGQVIHPLGSVLTDAVRALGRAEQVTPFMILLTALEVILSRYHRTDDLVVGVPVALRDADTQACPGCLINTVAIRTRLPRGSTFGEQLARVREQVVAAMAHADLPYIRVVEALTTAEGADSAATVFRVFFNYIDQRDFVDAVGALTIQPYPERVTAAKFDLTVYAHDWGKNLELQLVYDAALYDEATIALFAAQLESLLQQVCSNPKRDCADYTLGGHRPSSTKPIASEKPELLHLSFLRQASTEPERIAVKSARVEWTYAELRDRASRLAHRLRSGGCGDGDRVAILAKRDEELVAGVLAVLMAGAVFTVIDRELPSDLALRTLRCFEPRLLLDCLWARDLDGWLKDEDLRGVPRVSLKDQPSGDDVTDTLPTESDVASGDRPAYVVFTSGTTGEPKGILTSHGAVSRFLDWQRRECMLNGEDHVSLLSGLGHDPLLRDVFAPLSVGARLCIPSDTVRKDPARLARWVAEHGLTVLHLTPALERILAAGVAPGTKLDSLAHVFFGGDRLDWATVQSVRSYASTRIINGYGLSETPQLMLAERVEGTLPLASVPLGRPLPGVTVTIEDAKGRRCDPNVPGEIVFRTPWLARGYLDKGSLSEFTDGVFRTGDQGRLDAQGRVHFLGRADRQVKISGHRVELEGVERVLLGVEGVLAAHACVLRTDGEPNLTAFVVQRSGQLHTAAQLQHKVGVALGTAAVPRVVLVSELPLTPNGKPDTKRLLAEMRAVPPAGTRAPSDARTQTDELVVALWQRVLGVNSVRMSDDFFALGGNSLQAVRMVSLLGQELGKVVPLDLLLHNPTAREFVDALVQGVRGPEQLVLKANEQGTRPPLWMMHPVGGHVLFVRRMAARLDAEQPVFGIQSRGLDGTEPPVDDLVLMAAHYVEEIKSHQPTGPYYLAGPSLGGRIAYEVAQQLVARGDSIALLVMFDSWATGFPRRKRLDQWFRDKVRQYSRYLREGSAWDVVGRLRRRTPFGYARYGVVDEDELNDVQSRAIARIVAANQRASRNYVMKRYDGKVTVFRASRIPNWPGVDFSDWGCGWSRWARSVEVVDIDCTHQNMLDPPALDDVAHHLRKLLEPHEPLKR